MSNRKQIDEKRRKTTPAFTSIESSDPPEEDIPEQDVVPEFEGDIIEINGETSERIAKPLKKPLTSKRK
ncbi:MAG: hypothetical protein FK734_17765 [Asgard group archaeon]|nr:hypothetical protein [Asgard group archaeon]